MRKIIKKIWQIYLVICTTYTGYLFFRMISGKETSNFQKTILWIWFGAVILYFVFKALNMFTEMLLIKDLREHFLRINIIKNFTNEDFIIIIKNEKIYVSKQEFLDYCTWFIDRVNHISKIHRFKDYNLESILELKKQAQEILESID